MELGSLPLCSVSRLVTRVSSLQTEFSETVFVFADFVLLYAVTLAGFALTFFFCLDERFSFVACTDLSSDFALSECFEP